MLLTAAAILAGDQRERRAKNAANRAGMVPYYTQTGRSPKDS